MIINRLDDKADVVIEPPELGLPIQKQGNIIKMQGRIGKLWSKPKLADV